MPQFYTFYDLELPPDFNYSWALGKTAVFLIPVNASEYAKGTIQEQTILQFHDKQSVKNYFDTLQMPNIVRGMMKYILGMNFTELYNRIKYGFHWGGGQNSPQWATYVFTASIYGYDEAYVKLTLYNDYGKPQSMVWELIIKLPTIGTDYEVTFTRCPKA